MKNIIRIEKRDKFTVISRKLLEDKRLKWSTRGILAYLLSKPDNWVLQIVDLKKNGDLGRDAVYDRIKQAIEYGYISRIALRNENGRMYGVEYIVREYPDKPYPENQYAVKPDSEKPDTAKTYISKDSGITNTKKITTTTEKKSVCSSKLCFHKKISNFQKNEITELLQSFDGELAQNILYELSGFIDKNLVKKDVVSLAEGLANRARNGEFKLRLGVIYRESRLNEKSILKQWQSSIDNVVDITEVDLSNPLVRKILNIKK